VGRSEAAGQLGCLGPWAIPTAVSPDDLTPHYLGVNDSRAKATDSRRVMAPVEITDDYYAILEISHTADCEDIKKSFRRLARLLHPDKNPGKQSATASFQLVSSVTPECMSKLKHRLIYVCESSRGLMKR